MSGTFEAAERFLRPSDPGRVRRNQRQIRARHLFVWLGNTLIAVTLLAGLAWGMQRARSDARFAVRHIEIVGAEHTPRGDLDRVTGPYLGMNLFRIDIARVRRDLGGVPWISHIAIEKTIPDTLRIRIDERRPVALVLDGRCAGHPARPCALRYVDEQGVAFAELSPHVGDDDLPLISQAAPDQLLRCVEVLGRLRREQPEIYGEISEVHPVPPAGFAFFDRRLGTYVWANGEDVAERWRWLTEITKVEGFDKGSIEYADLRFADRVIVKPVRPAVSPALPASTTTVPVTN
jgi:cell division septal protein FtsQ